MDFDAYDVTSAYAFVSHKPDGWRDHRSSFLMDGTPFAKVGKRRRPRKFKIKGVNLRDPWWQKYHAYIKSPGWKRFKRAIIVIRGKRCQRCGAASGRMDLHHLSYKRLGTERAEDVMLLCYDCHKKAHPDKRM